jgi:RHS repeat-associated protein
MPKDYFTMPKGYCTMPKAYCTMPKGYCIVPKAYFTMPKDYFTMPKDYFTMPKDYFTMPKDYFTMPKAYFTMPKAYCTMPKEYYTILKKYFTLPKLNQCYAYQYDNLNRLKAAFYQKAGVATNAYNESLTYDKNGNILTLNRNGTSETATAIDNLAYTYEANTNKLTTVTDATTSLEGFKDGNKTGLDYTYDVNGNMTIDKNKGITLIAYNHLNLPTQITFSGTNRKINYLYNATGQKLRKIVTEGTTVTTTDYLGGYQYLTPPLGVGGLQFFPTSEGYVAYSQTLNAYSYVYQYKDHLGNIRLSYSDANNDKLITNNEIVEESNYYPFGLKQTGYNNVTNSLGNSSAQKRLYNGKELQGELGLNMYDYGARNYDATIGRWMNIDPLAELSRRWSPYNYVYNNPIIFVDPDGMIPEKTPEQEQEEKERDAQQIENLNEFLSSIRPADSPIAQADAEEQERINRTGGGRRGVSRNKKTTNKKYKEIKPKDKVKAKVIDNTSDAKNHYDNGDGSGVLIGMATRNLLRLSRNYQNVIDKLVSGKAKNLNSTFDVDMTGKIFHIGDTNVDYSTNCSEGTCTTTFTEFVNDGFWDPNVLDEFIGSSQSNFRPDGMGPNLETQNGHPYPYIPSTYIIIYPNPGY